MILELETNQMIFLTNIIHEKKQHTEKEIEELVRLKNTENTQLNVIQEELSLAIKELENLNIIYKKLDELTQLCDIRA